MELLQKRLFSLTFSYQKLSFRYQSDAVARKKAQVASVFLEQLLNCSLSASNRED